MSKTHIAVAFSLKKGQNIFGFLPALRAIAKANPDAILVHGFMDRATVEQKKIDTALIDALDELFPNQLNFFKDGEVDRQGMKNTLWNNSGTAYIIGKQIEGVKEEMLLYVQAGVKVVTVEYNEVPEGETELFTGTDLVSFANAVLGKIKGNTKEVSHADLENWKEAKSAAAEVKPEEKHEEKETGGGVNGTVVETPQAAGSGLAAGITADANVNGPSPDAGSTQGGGSPEPEKPKE